MSDTIQPSFCSHCGAPLTPGSAFCDQCGHRIAQEPSAPPPITVPAATPPAPAPSPAATFTAIERTQQQSSKSLPMIIVILVAAVLGVGGGLLYEQLKKGKAGGPPAGVTTSPDKPAILSDPVGAFDDKGTPPVEVAYIHFLDEAHRLTNGNIRVGSPKSTPTRIEVRVTAPNGKPEIVVVLEKSNDGRQATVIVGPKDAGAVRSYTLVLGPGGWTIQSFEDLEG
jgi:hypothetical protein